MSSEPWRYAVLILREDHSSVGQLPVSPDWDAIREWLRFTALRQGMSVDRALALDCWMEPVWHAERGAPWVSGVRARARGTGLSHESVELTTECFAAPARAAIASLVEEGRIEQSETVRYVPLAFAQGDDDPLLEEAPRFTTRTRTPSLPIIEGSLNELLARSRGTLDELADADDDVPAFVPQSMIDEVRALTRRVHGVFEIGGLLVGHLGRDIDGGGLFVRVTVQLLARHIEADSTHLTFTSDTWTEFRRALELRGHDEIMLGFWHSHPVREWCKKCAMPKQRECALRGDFFSAQDRHMHRAMFPRAYSLALVVNDIAYDEPTLSMFGWRRGEIDGRGFHVLDSHPIAGSTLVRPEGVVHA